jgi:hygromycin-B 4-O-kinase
LALGSIEPREISILSLVMAKPHLSIASVEAFLRPRWPSASDVTLLSGGAWSSAYRFTTPEQLLVVKFGSHRDDYERDALAGTFQLPDAPTPPVLELGEAFDGCYSIAPFHRGEGFDQLAPGRIREAQRYLMRAYESLSTVAMPGSGYGIWIGPSGDAPHHTWAEFLTAIPQRDDDRLRGWQERLAAEENAKSVFDAAQREVERRAPNSSDERSVNHCDPLQGNILIGPDNRPTALLDWGTSIVGDPLYDLAMLMFCAHWVPSIDTALLRDDAVRRAHASEAGERLYVSQLHIGLSAMQYQAFAGQTDFLRMTADLVDHIRSAGPNGV